MNKLAFVILTLFFSQSVLADSSVQQNIVVVMDDSGSMSYGFGKSNRMEIAKTALQNVLSNLPDNTNLGVVTLNGNWNQDGWLIPFGQNDKKVTAQKIGQLRPTGGTPLGGCMKAACDVLLQKRAKQRYGHYLLLIVTDGQASDQSIVDRYTPDIMRRGITVDVIGIDMASEHVLSKKVSHYHRADDPKQFTAALKTALAEVNNKDNKSNDDDFKVISPIPDAMATKVLNALSENENQPVGDAPTNNQQSSVIYSPTPSSGGHTLLWIGGGVVGVVLLCVFVKAIS